VAVPPMEDNSIDNIMKDLSLNHSISKIGGQTYQASESKRAILQNDSNLL